MFTENTLTPPTDENMCSFIYELIIIKEVLLRNIFDYWSVYNDTSQGKQL